MRRRPALHPAAAWRRLQLRTAPKKLAGVHIQDGGSGAIDADADQQRLRTLQGETTVNVAVAMCR